MRSQTVASYAALIAIVVACGRSSRTSTGNDGGTGGNGGAAGRSASSGGAGAPGSGGGAGTVTTSSGGAGAPGSGGGAGTAATEVPSWSFGCDPERSLVSTCSRADTCRALRCGEPSSEFDSSVCERRPCQSSDDCASNERCMAAPLLGDFSCRPAYFEGCSVIDGECACNSDPLCLGTSYCLTASEHPPADDCPLGGTVYCAMYEHDHMMLDNYLSADPAAPGDTQAALRACAAKLQRHLDVCSGASSAGGAPEVGNGGAGSGGEAGR